MWGKNRARLEARIGKVNAQKAELEQTRQLLASSVARLYWEWQTQAAVGEVLAQIKHEQDNIIGADRELYQHGITSSVEGVETDINASKTEEQIAEVIKSVLAELGIENPAPSDKGKIMKTLMPKVKGKADGKVVNQGTRDEIMPQIMGTASAVDACSKFYETAQ